MRTNPNLTNLKQPYNLNQTNPFQVPKLLLQILKGFWLWIKTEIQVQYQKLSFGCTKREGYKLIRGK